MKGKKSVIGIRNTDMRKEERVGKGGVLGMRTTLRIEIVKTGRSVIQKEKNSTKGMEDSAREKKNSINQNNAKRNGGTENSICTVGRETLPKVSAMQGISQTFPKRRVNSPHV